MSEMFALLERAQEGDDEACQQVLTENSGLIWSIVKRYYGCGVETDDESGLAVGIVRANDQTHNRIVINADLWFGTSVLSAPAGATTAGAVNVGTQ